MTITRPTSPTQAGRRIPNTRSREYLSGSRIMRAVEMAMLRTGNSAPPSVTQIGFPQWAFLVAIDIDPMTPSGPRGLRSPKAVSTPPPELRESRQVGPGASRAHAEHLHEAARALQPWPSEGSEELLGSVTSHERALRHAHDHGCRFVDLRGVHPHSFRGLLGTRLSSAKVEGTLIYVLARNHLGSTPVHPDALIHPIAWKDNSPKPVWEI